MRSRRQRKVGKPGIRGMEFKGRQITALPRLEESFASLPMALLQQCPIPIILRIALPFRKTVNPQPALGKCMAQRMTDGRYGVRSEGSTNWAQGLWDGTWTSPFGHRVDRWHLNDEGAASNGLATKIMSPRRSFGQGTPRGDSGSPGASRDSKNQKAGRMDHKVERLPAACKRLGL